VSWWALLLLAWGLAAAVQLGLWLWQRRTGSATVVDAGWAGSLAGMALLYAFLGEGALEHRALVGITGRARVRPANVAPGEARPRQEDPRYRELRRRWRERGDEQVRFFVFFQAQALAAVLLSLPLLAAA
jgi:steroid 5-alpha reductase family enzyme